MPLPEPTIIRIRPDADLVTWWYNREADPRAPAGMPGSRATLFYRDCWVRGAVAWPDEPDEKTGLVEGCWLVGCVDSATGTSADVLRIYSERMFAHIDPLLTRDGALTDEGPTGWLRTMWERYGCATYYEHQEEHVTMRWHRMVRESQQIGVALRFPRIEWKDSAEADAEIEEALARNRIEYRGGSAVHKTLVGRGLGAAPDILPPVWRAVACLVGAAERRRRAVMNGLKQEDDE